MQILILIAPATALKFPFFRFANVWEEFKTFCTPTSFTKRGKSFHKNVFIVARKNLAHKFLQTIFAISASMAGKRIWWLNRSMRSPLLSTRNLEKFHEMHPGRLRFRNLNNGCELGPLTSTFEKVSAKSTCCWLRNDLMSAEVFSGIPMNWLLGKKRTTQSKTKSFEDCCLRKHERTNLPWTFRLTHGVDWCSALAFYSRKRCWQSTCTFRNISAASLRCHRDRWR